jgi:hypothetical protein
VATAVDALADPALPMFVGVGSHRRPRRVTVPDTGDDDELWT